MSRADRSGVTDVELLRNAALRIRRERANTADLVADLAEIDLRGLHRDAGFPSMFVYCVDGLGLSEDAAYRRIQVARAVRKFPVLVDALADGRLHLTGACLIVPHLTPENAGELIGAASHARKSAIEAFLSRRFPRMEALLAPAVPAVRSAAPVTVPQLAPAQVEVPATGMPAVETVIEVPAPPIPALYDIRATISEATHEKLERARSFLRHSNPDGDFESVLGCVLDVFLAQCEKTKAGVGRRPKTVVRPTRSKRHVPAAVKRAVWRRDGGRCTFVGIGGRRCGSRDFVEFDHVAPVARGGRATIDGMRLLCRAHNDLEAERVFGASFMAGRRAGRAP